jgi:hypothetical protein
LQQRSLASLHILLRDVRRKVIRHHLEEWHEHMPVHHNDRNDQQRVAVFAQEELDLSWTFLSVKALLAATRNYESTIFIPKYDN